MEKLINDICEKTGISTQQAEQAIKVVSDSLKSKLPYVLHRQIDNLIAGGTLSAGVKEKLSELKNDAEDAALKVGKAASEMAEDVKKKMNDFLHPK